MHNFDIAKPFSFIVDGNGERYFNECASYVEMGERLYQRHQQTGKAAPSWWILDSRFLRWYPIGLNAPGRIPKQWFDSGYLRKADTLEALAAVCGIDGAGLRRTADRFNRFARNGVDDDFQRGARQYDRWRGDPTQHPNPCLGTVERPPFYAIAMYPSDVGTTGGVLTDEHARVLRSDGSVLPGLYATGNCAASLFGHTYPAAGASIGASFVFGYVAAHRAAGAALGVPATRADTRQAA